MTRRICRCDMIGLPLCGVDSAAVSAFAGAIVDKEIVLSDVVGKCEQSRCFCRQCNITRLHVFVKCKSAGRAKLLRREYWNSLRWGRFAMSKWSTSAQRCPPNPEARGGVPRSDGRRVDLCPKMPTEPGGRPFVHHCAARKHRQISSSVGRMSDAEVGDGRGNSDVRRHNLSLVLRLVHQSNGVPRSVLTRTTGLNRSTIAALVGELVERQLVVEAEPDANNQVGRPSPLALPGPRAVAIAVNPELDAITVGVVGLGATVLRRVRRPLEKSPSVAEAVRISAELIAELRTEFDAGHAIVGVGVAIPGLVRARDGVVRLAPHLHWVDEPFAAELEAATGLPVAAANDANLGTRAESLFGAGKGVSDLIYLNGGASGIGGGIVSGGRALTGVEGYAGEFGHTMVATGGAQCHCGASGCLEAEVRKDRLLALTGLADADSDELEAALLSRDSADIRAEALRQLDYLGIALRNAVNILNPSTIILGGFLGSLYAVAPEHLDRLIATGPLAASSELVRIQRSELGANRLMIGAAELAFEPILDDPSFFSAGGAAAS
jgi:predicted NBD/HSP70 family sugar kinase